MFRRFLLHKAIGDKGLLLILPKPPLCPRLLLGTFVGNVFLGHRFLGSDPSKTCFTIRYDTLAANPDIRLECIRHSHEPASDSQMESEDVVNSDLATGDMEVLCHRN